MTSTLFGLALLLASLGINFYAGQYAKKEASNPVTDVILSNIRTFELDGIFVWGGVAFWIIVIALCLYRPQRIPFVLKSVSLFVLIRAVFISITHIGPFPTEAVVDYTTIIGKFTSGGDLFFSGHTGLPFMLALMFWREPFLRIFFLSASVFFGVVVLLAHLHYSIDVLAAFFITYSIYHLACHFFPEEQEMFTGGIFK